MNSTGKAPVKLVHCTVTTGIGGGIERMDALYNRYIDRHIIDPLVCEAARASGVPVLIELMHLTEPGQIYPDRDISVCVSETVRGAQPFSEKTVVIHNGIDIVDFPFNGDPDTGENIIMLESTRREKKMHFHLDETAD